MKNQKMTFKRVPHYGLRKLTVGVASVLLSTSLYLGAATVTGSADQVTTAPTETSSQLVTQAGNASSQASGQSQTSAATISSQAAQANSSSASINENQASSAASSSNANQSAASQSNESQAVTVQPTSSINSLVGTAANDIRVTAKVTETKGDLAAGTPGETHLALHFDVPAEQIQKIQAGDYIDVKLGLPYTINGQQYVMSYGAINAHDGIIKMLYFDNSHDLVVGYIRAAGNVNSYAELASNNGGALQEVINHNDQSDSLGTSNGYYQIVFTDGFQKYLQSHQVGQSGDWTVDLDLSYYNDASNGVRKAEEPASFNLYGTEDGTYTPNNDLQIGNLVSGSGISFKVVKSQQDVTKSNETVAIDHSGNVPAHRWAKIDGHYVLGAPDKANPAATPEQGVGLSLSSQTDADGNPLLGNHFDIQVTKPADAANLLTLSFVSAESLQEQLQRLIVPKNNQAELVDQVVGSNAYLSNQYLYQQPIVHVTANPSSDGNTITYHVTIENEYGGFRANSSHGNLNDAIVTLINWMPEDTESLLPPESIQTPTEDNQAVTYINPGQNQWFAGYPIRNQQIKNYLARRPWHITVSNGQTTFLNQDQGYWIDRATDLRPGTSGIASTYFYGFVNETIHYVDSTGHQMKDARGTLIPDATATVVFQSDPTTNNSFNDEHGFSNVPVPPVAGYTTYAGVQNGDQQLVVNNGQAETTGNPINAYGYITPFKYPHQDIVLYVVYVPTQPSNPTQPTSGTQPTNPTQPTSVTQPTAPTSVTQPTNPTQPTSVTQPTAPTSVTQPTNPTQPTSVTQPTAPTSVTQPTNPTQPTTVTQPTAPTSVTQPTNPTQPTTVTQPTQPKGETSEPTQPTNPTSPTAPTSPTTPLNPSQPTGGQVPGQPSQPTTPAQPNQPQKPETPVQPGQPLTPANPTQPSQPQKLPQTGNSHSAWSLIAVGLASLLSFFGLSKKHQKD